MSGRARDIASRMSFSELSIRRPVGVILLSIGLLLLGGVAYSFLPVASIPTVEFPAIRVSASRPGADPQTMAATVAAPLERALGGIPGVNELTSQSSLGSTSISIQFDLSRKIDSAARDVQAALNAAVPDLPGDMPSLPQFRKMNPASQPVLILALTSQTLTTSAIYDAADTIIAQRLSQVEGVAEVSVNGAEQPAIRVRIDPTRLANMGIGLDAVRTAILNANAQTPVGSFEGATQSQSIGVNDQLTLPAEYEKLVVRSTNGVIVQLGDVAEVVRGVRNTRAAGWFDHRPAVILNVTKLPNANVIETVDGVKAQLPLLNRLLPAGIDIHVMSDRTEAIRASVADIKHTLAISIGLVMLVVFLFLRRAAPTLAAGVTVPLALAGTFAAMWVARYSVDNLSLMALTISVGFVVDDAIVMIENVHRNREAGMGRIAAAIAGAKQISFTVISISLSLVAAFIPLLFLPGIVGRLFREFSMTLVFAIAVSTIVSLSVTPMICAHFVRDETGRKTWLDRAVEGVLSRFVRFYARTLEGALNYPWFMLFVLVLTIALTVQLFRQTPKGFVPQDDSGLLFGFAEASPDVSFPAMMGLQQSATDIIADDPAVQSIASFVGNGSSVYQGRMYVVLKPPPARRETAFAVIARIRLKLANVAGIQIYLSPVGDLRGGARQGKSRLQYSLYGPDFNELDRWARVVTARLKTLPQLVDVSSDRNAQGLQATIVVDRPVAARLGVSMQNVDAALNNAFGQAQVSTIYAARNQYRVVLETPPARSRDPSDLNGLYVTGAAGAQIPLAAVARVERGSAPLTINHQGQFPSITITYDAALNVAEETANNMLEAAIADLHLPETVHGEFAGDAKSSQESSSGQGPLLLVALLAVYIILGVLYESLIHPLTIISTLPSACLGALLALNVMGMDLNIIGLIGLILLIGLVKKNGIMLVDFAIVAERQSGLDAREAIRRAAIERFRPILMTTLAALFGALPLALGTGPGSELRRPLGIAIVGGLLLSQALTLYTTPAIFLLLDKLRRRSRKLAVPDLTPS
ncbi:MAG: acriflavin resistance protein [Hyphomicrobiales bacterium]|nr:acriflavin resistance protein [Hyphomicrobiales bacterium]